mmetsp:Transcript_30370/g.63486  ORF Transcript_30370/g.63486 Transcript_30370/m.63486 type:complete len:262 (+) Transcript_30370:150-935(+)
MADVQYWDDTLTDEVQSIRNLLQQAEGLADREQASALDRAEKKIRAAQGTKKSYKMETRLVSDPRQRTAYENKLTGLSQELGSCANDLKALRGGAQRGMLFDGARGNNNSSAFDGNDGMTGEEAGDIMINDMNNIQDKTKESLQNTKNMVAASKEVGEATMGELLRQREQIRTIDDEAMRIEDNLNRADKLIKTFGKRMATDRFIQCFACVNIMLLAGVVLYSVLRKDKGEDEVDQGVPASPVDGERLLRGLLYGNENNDW